MVNKINSAGFQSLKYMYYIHVIMTKNDFDFDFENSLVNKSTCNIN